MYYGVGGGEGAGCLVENCRKNKSGTSVHDLEGRQYSNVKNNSRFAEENAREYNQTPCLILSRVF